MRTYVSGGNALPYIVNNEQLGGLIYDPNSGAFVSLPVVATDSAPAMVDTSAVLSASFLGNSGSVIQALNYLRAASDASNDAAGSTTQVQYNDSGEFGASSGLVFASNTLTLDVGGVSAVSLTASGGALTVGTTEVLEADIAKIDGITNGAGAAAKALVLDANADIASGLRSLTGSGDVFFANGHYSNDVRAVDLIASTNLSVGSTTVGAADLLKIDGITNGAGAAAKALVLDANADIASGLRSLTGSGDVFFANGHYSNDVRAVDLIASTNLSVGSTTVGAADLLKIDGITNGAGAAAKALVLDANADIASGLRSLTGSGDVFFVNGHYSGDVRAKIGDFTSLDLNSGGITDAGAIAGASTIVATGQASVATLSVASDDFVVDGSGNVTSVGSINMTGDITGSSYRTNRTLMTGSGQGTVLRAYGTIMNNMTPIAVGDSAAEAQINDIPHIQIMGTDSGGLLQEFKFQVSGGILQVNQV